MNEFDKLVAGVQHAEEHGQLDEMKVLSHGLTAMMLDAEQTLGCPLTLETVIGTVGFILHRSNASREDALHDALHLGKLLIDAAAGRV
jgi:hypothetical protein